jgi:hypothetical protein
VGADHDSESTDECTPVARGLSREQTRRLGHVEPLEGRAP